MDILEPDFILPALGIVDFYDFIEQAIKENKRFKGNRAERKLFKERTNGLIKEYNSIRGCKCFKPIK